MRYRKRPVVVDAWKFTGQDRMDWPEPFASETTLMADLPESKPMVEAILIGTLEGTMRADIGDWIIRGVKGEFYPCKPDIFEAIYEPVSP
ncbi:hypothetical protein LB545_07665 [Mesorhizobium sp. BR1-1-6]|uniref:hypothetical protein n=1 Tax=Mesorhizobium sp. BR1-1-6 TaxID=2876648 RepID=UPI001CD05692|nr:hypothetical protein [Mesorhizobium sp. BR1-1-6]MBZ9894220.1 hypothetical protein [Mesorhizobium sp. BR1-1-6]